MLCGIAQCAARMVVIASTAIVFIACTKTNREAQAIATSSTTRATQGQAGVEKPPFDIPCEAGVYAGTLSSPQTGNHALTIAGTDTHFPWEHYPKKLFIAFCDNAYTSRFLRYTGGGRTIPNLQISKGTRGPTFHLRAASAHNTGKDHILVLEFRSITVTSPF